MAGGTGHTVGDNTTCEGPSIEQAAQGLETASDVAIIDDFEDQNLNEYTETRNNGGVYSFNGTEVKNGNYSLEFEDPDGTSNLSINSTTGLENYPGSGDTFKWWVQYLTSDSPFAQTQFAVQNESNEDDLYRIRFSLDEFTFRLRQNGNASQLGTSSINISSGNWYQIVVDWGSSGSFTIELNKENGTNITTLSFTDTTFTSGGFGFFFSSTGNGDKAIYDYARIV